MTQPRQSQSQSRLEQSKRRGRFTGERLLRERPRVYRKVVELLAEPGMSINQITKLCRVSEHTVRAVRDREAITIAERKQRLMSIFGNVAELGAERMEELAPHATLRDAGMAAGIATDKLLALLGETGGGVPVQINMHTGVAEALQKRYNELVRQAELSIENKKALPNGKTLIS
jgi:transposase